MTVIALTASTFEVVWDQLRLGELPTVLTVKPRGFTKQERKSVIDEARRELRTARLVDSDGDIDRRLADWLSLLARPRRSIDARLHSGHEVRALLAATDHAGALGVLTDDYVTVQGASPGSLGHQAVGLLPEAPTGQGHSVSLPAAALAAATEAAGDDPVELERAFRSAGLAQLDARQLAKMLSGSVHVGNFGAATVDRDGRRHRADHVLGWWCGERGRYLVEDRQATDGTTWTTVAPTDSARLARQLDALMSALERRVEVTAW